MMDFFNSAFGGAVLTVVLSAAVRALPDPPEGGGMFYRFVFNFAHAILSNYDKVLQQRKPGITNHDKEEDNEQQN